MSESIITTLNELARHIMDNFKNQEESIQFFFNCNSYFFKTEYENPDWFVRASLFLQKKKVMMNHM